MGLTNGNVFLENNYNLWQKMFIDERKYLESIFSNDNIIIEHVGSTAIKGLKAKPIVDIAIGVNNLTNINKYITALENVYTVKQIIDKGEILLIKENSTETFCLIHILNKDSDRFKNMIKFRDILNNDNNILREYEELKKHLSDIYQNDRKMYTESKNEFIKNVLEKH